MTASFKTLTKTTARVKIVDIGANPLDVPPYAAILEAGDAELVGFEPNREGLAQLNASKGPFETYLPHAVGDGGVHTLHYCMAPGMTSLLQPNMKVLGLMHGFPQWAQVTGTEQLPTVRLDDVPEAAGADFIKMDIQGAELMVLQNAEARLAEAVLVQAEVEFLEMYVGQPLFADVDAFMRARGFMLHRFFPTVSRVIQPMLVGNSIYAEMSQLCWADAIYIRDLTRLELLNDMQLLRLASLLHDCYASHDVVLHLLVEYDRRTKAGLGDRYLSGLQTG